MNSSGKELTHVHFAKFHRKNVTTFTLTPDIQKKESDIWNSIFHVTGSSNGVHRTTVSTAVQVDGPGMDGPGSDAGDGEQVESGEAENAANNSPGKAVQANIGDNSGLPEKHLKSGDKSNFEGSTNNSVGTQNQNPNVTISESNASDTSVDTSQFADCSTETDFKDKNNQHIVHSSPKKEPSSPKEETLPKNDIPSKANENAVQGPVAVVNKVLPRSPDETVSLKTPSKASLSESGVMDDSSLDNIFQD